MGDPVQTGIPLDGIHRPRISWKLVSFIGVISLLSILIQTVIGISQDPAGGLSGGLNLNITAGDIKKLLSLFCKYDPTVHGSLSGMVSGEKGKDIDCCMGCGDPFAGFVSYMGSCFSWVCRVSARPFEFLFKWEI